MQRRIIPSITTHGHTSSDWRSKIAEVQPLGLVQVALFVTGISVAQRKQCFHLLTELQSQHFFTIPFVHAVSSMQEAEYWFLADNFGTEKFNLHPARQYAPEYNLSEELRSRIYIENCFLDSAIIKEDLAGYAGICFDLSHLEDTRQVAPTDYYSMLKLAQSQVVGANHISAHVVDFESNSNLTKSSHVFSQHEDFSYLSNILPHCMTDLCALELENSLSEQLDVIEFVSQQLNLNTSSALLKKVA